MQHVLTLLSLLTSDERRRVAQILAGIAIMGIVEVIGVTSILPFLTAVMHPATVTELPVLKSIRTSFGLSTEGLLFLLGFGSLVVVILSNLMSLLLHRAILGFSFGLNREFGIRMMSGYMAQPYPFFLDRNSTKLMLNSTGEVEGVVNGVLLPGLQAISKLVAALFILVVVVAIDPWLALAFLGIFGGAYIVIFLLIKGRVTKYGDQALGARRSLFAAATEAFGSIKELKMFGREDFYVDQFSASATQYARSQIAHGLVAITPRYLVEATAFGAIIFVVLFLLKSGRDFQSAVPYLALYAFTGYRLMPAFQTMFQNLTTVRANWPSVKLLASDVHLQASERAALPSAQPMPFNREIRLEAIAYAYPGVDVPALKGVSMEIRKNTTIGLVGESGAGKTTIVDIVLGLLTPTAGRLEIDGVEVTAANVRSWQRNIGYVPQQIYLSDASIAHNIAFGIPQDKIDIAKVQAAARAAQLHDFIVHELPEGYDSNVGERGIKLSGGQRQRIGIARALYHDPPVLVLDEATSALDGLTEEAVVEAIHNLGHAKTILTIAHRITTVVHCDVICVLDRGRVIDRGSYTELIGRNQRFRDMAKVA